MNKYFFFRKIKISVIFLTKSENEITSYRPFSLLSLFSKIFEKIFLRRLLAILKENKVIPEHRFGFRRYHGTPEQCHRVINYIIDALERKEYCSAAFLDIQQAFDKVWHHGLLYKLKKVFSSQVYLILKSYLTSRPFYVKINDDTSMQEYHREAFLILYYTPSLHLTFLKLKMY
uniref:RNA-directed DNA polymerase from mobile element jockey n=1 Tax=Bactrocera latifrons TaxID=174628 RepID=A0A0K8UDZ9_BACLA